MKVPDLPDMLNELFGIRLTDKERTLLTHKDDMLDPYDVQRKYILRMALQTIVCPACGTPICQRSAGGPKPEDDTPVPDDSYVCPKCEAKLTWHLGMIGGEQWFTLNPGQTITTGQTNEGK